ncbi:chromosome partitioning protein ParB [Anabaena minutissima FACHB-250]|nr:chromosome partitioning protein ParB [Anabaena minutissima FACHB-250]
MTKFLMVDIDSVTSSFQRSHFTETDLDILAEVILDAGGLIKPLVLKKIGFEKYEVIDGHFEYYAAVRACEKNPIAGEMVNALIITSEKEQEALKQANLLKKTKSTNEQSESVIESIGSITLNAESNKFRLLEKQLDDLKSELVQERQERQKLYETIKLFESQMPKQIAPLEAFNNLSLIELIFRLRTAGITDKKAVQVVESIEKERKKKKFESLKDVVERVTVASGKKRMKGISGDKMVDIVDTWSRVLFT